MIILRLMSLILIAHINFTNSVPHRFVEPINEANPTFLRSSVEYIPSDDQKSSSLKMASMDEDFEDVFNNHPFSRSAVESVPKTLVTQYLPLRSAVEYNPKDEYFSRTPSRSQRFLNIVYPSRPRQSKAYNLEAYIVPINTPFDNDPLYYRIGSPYQQLVDSESFERLAVGQPQEVMGGNAKMPQAKSFEYNVLCHTTNWAFYRNGEGKFVPENLDMSLCSHILYSFATLDPVELIMLEFDKWVDVENRLYTRTVRLANGIPVLLAMGGWTDSSGGKYSSLVSNKRNRENFIENAIPFLKRYEFSGLHVDWNYPCCPQSDCKRGNATDKMYFTQFIQELRSALQRNNLMLSISISGYKEIITQAYDFVALSKSVDFMSVMTYDYHGAWEDTTGHVSPLYGSSDDKYPQYNTDFTIKLLLESGADKKKIMMGVPFYGQSYTLSTKQQGFNSPVNGPGAPGEWTTQPGMLAYNEICLNLRKPNYKKGTDPTGKSGPYITDGSIWAGYDDVASMQKKAKYVMDQGLGGISAWTVDLDDFNNNCCSESFPLLKAINRALGRLNSPIGNDCTRPNVYIPPTVEMAVTVDSGAAGIPTQSQDDSYQQSTTSSYWSQPTQSTTTRRPAVQSTTKKPYTTAKPSQTSTLPSPVNVMPVVFDNAPCEEVGSRKPHPSTCTQYLVCAGNTWIAQPCPPGLYWNNDHEHCDWPANVKCEEKVMPAHDEIVTTKRTTEATTRRSTSSATRRSTTTRKTTPETSKRTTQTTTTTTTTRRPTTTRSTTTKRPNYYETTTAYYTTLVQSTSKKPSRKPTKCVNGEYYSHKDCSKYYICNNQKKVLQTCPDGLQYSQQYKICDYKDNVKCVSRKKYLKLLEKQYVRTGIYSATLLRAKQGDPCDDGQRYLSFPGQCSSYLECVHRQLLKRECASGLQFDLEIMNCNYPKGSCQNDESLDEYEENSNEINEDDEDEITNEIKPPSTAMKPPMPSKPLSPTPSKPATPTTSLDTIPVNDEVQPLKGKYKLVCYFTNWAWYRPGDGKYLPDNIKANLCTHVVYGFAVLNYDELTIRTHDSWADIDNRFYERVVELKNRGVKVTLAIGGWNDSAGDKYSRLVRSPAARAKFIRHVVEFLEKYGFEGLDLDWEYPVCWQVDCTKGHKDEKEHFASFVRELSQAFKPKGLLLSSAVSPSKTVIDAGYDVVTLARYFDWIAVMCYDYHGQWDKKTGHVAPHYFHPNDDVDFFNTDFTMRYWIELGAPKEKLVMGMPLYGQSFTLADPKNNGLNAKAPGPGLAGEFTRAAGFLAYYEICDRIINRGWEVVQDPLGRMGPYAYKGNQWVSFDDQNTLKRKAQYIKQLGIGGGMIWALDLDDFRGKCNQGEHPLLKVIHAELQDETVNEIQPASTEDPIDNEPQEPEQEMPEVNQETPVVNEEWPEVNNENTPDNEEEVEEGPVEETQEADDEDYDEESNELDEYDGQYKVVCYFTNWAWYRPGIGKFKPEDIDGDLCTHIVYGFAVLNRETLTIQPHDSWADIDNNFYSRVVEFKKKGVKVTIAIGGWNDSAGDKYSRLVRSPEARARFVKHVIEFIEKHNFDGLDLDWEYPVCWQVECNKGNPDEKDAFTQLVKELHDAFKPKGLLLSSAVSPSKKVIDAGYNVPLLSRYFDWIAVMCYDYHGQWDKKTGHVAPMYEHPEAWEKTFNANFTINYWIEKGANPRKLIFGMPMYGQSFSLADRGNIGLNSPTYGGGEAGEETRARGFLAYYEICERIKKRNWKVVKDLRGTIGPYAYSGDQWVSFDDVRMIQHKSEYVKAVGLGGAMIWALDLDDFKNTCDCEEYPLLRTINRVLRKYPGPHNNCLLETRKSNAKPTAEETTIKPVYVPPVTTMKPSSTRAPSTTRPRKTTSTEKPRKTTSTEKPVVEEGDEDYDEDEEYPEQSDETFMCPTGRLFYPDPNNCATYFMCNHGKPIQQQCSHGLHWNSVSSICDWPSQANCQIKENDEESNDVYPSASSTTKRPQYSTQKTTTAVTTTTSPRPTRPPVESTYVPTGNNEFMVVCYFTNWAWYRPGIGKYKPEDIDTKLCTHVVYGFAVLNGETLTIRTHDSWADIDNNFYTRVTALKERGVKVSIAIGGWNDSLGDKYSRLVRDPAARKRFIKSVIEFMKKYDFDGFDLDWEYPVCWQVDCTKGKPEEKQAFSDLVRELKEAFKPDGYLLSAAVSPSKKVIDAGYDIPVLADLFDWIAVMCYDYHGQWDKKTGHVAPLYEHPDAWEKTFNADFTIRYWIEKGAPSKKLVMGMPMYGQSFTTEKPDAGLNALSTGPGLAGEFTRSAGFLAFYEICYKINSGGYTVVKDPNGHIGPYAYKDRQWFSYDDVEMIRRKTKYVKDMKLGGAMIWALDLDDFRNRCGCGTHPLLSTINLELNRISTSKLSDCT